MNSELSQNKCVGFKAPELKNQYFVLAVEISIIAVKKNLY